MAARIHVMADITELTICEQKNSEQVRGQILLDQIIATSTFMCMYVT